MLEKTPGMPRVATFKVMEIIVVQPMTNFSLFSSLMLHREKLKKQGVDLLEHGLVPDLVVAQVVAEGQLFL